MNDLKPDLIAAASKFRALVAGCIAGATGFIGWLVTMPPESQVGFLAPLIALCPVQAQPYIGTAMKALSAASTAYAVYKASQSGSNNPKLTQAHLDALDSLARGNAMVQAFTISPELTTIDREHPILGPAYAGPPPTVRNVTEVLAQESGDADGSAVIPTKPAA